MENSQKQEKKLTHHILIEGGRSFTEKFLNNQKLQVIVNKTIEHFNLTDVDKRQLTRGDNTVLDDYKLTIEEVGLRDGETLRFILNAAPTPGEPKKFA